MIDRPSPNRNGRPGPIRCVVIHCDASPNEEATLSWTGAAKSKVSYHVLVGRDGTAYRIVPDELRAWAVGYAVWRGVKDVNGCSLSVAFSNRNDGKEPLTPAQVAGVKAVIAAWRAKWHIEDVTTHKIVSRWPDGTILKNGARRKHDAEAAPNFSLQDFL